MRGFAQDLAVRVLPDGVASELGQAGAIVHCRQALMTRRAALRSEHALEDLREPDVQRFDYCHTPLKA